MNDISDKTVALDEIRQAGSELVELSLIKLDKYPLLKYNLGVPIAKYFDSRAKNSIGLDDLPCQFIVYFNDGGRKIQNRNGCFTTKEFISSIKK